MELLIMFSGLSIGLWITFKSDASPSLLVWFLVWKWKTSLWLVFTNLLTVLCITFELKFRTKIKTNWKTECPEKTLWLSEQKRELTGMGNRVGSIARSLPMWHWFESTFDATYGCSSLLFAARPFPRYFNFPLSSKKKKKKKKVWLTAI